MKYIFYTVSFLIIVGYLSYGCTRHQSPATPFTVDTCVTDTPQINNFRVFIENSLSMNGYVRTGSNFNVALVELAIQISNHFNTQWEVSFINSEVFASGITS